MCEEIFGPVVTVFVYPDGAYEETLHLVDETSPYALTGAIFVQEQKAVDVAQEVLRNAAGNFYINDKPTGAVVGQQPFGGARMSGTNDKAGSSLNLLRWVSPRTVKETYVPPRDYRYGFMVAEPGESGAPARRAVQEKSQADNQAKKRATSQAKPGTTSKPRIVSPS
jgi:1-pyrroline-5-carboxylate dehydrogenase